MQKTLKIFLNSRKVFRIEFDLNLRNKLFLFKTNIKSFSHKNEESFQLEEKTSVNDPNDNTKYNQERIAINLNNIQGTRNSDSGYLVASFVCKKCDTRNTKKFSKRSYTEGIVIIRCDGCQNLHLIADNLGWFEDSNVNIEDLMKRKGEEVRKISCDGLLHLVSDENVKI